MNIKMNLKMKGKMKGRIIASALVLALSNLTGSEIFAQNVPAVTKVKPAQKLGAVLPFFSVQLTDTAKTTLDLDKLDPNKTLVIMLFNPTCEHCIAQGKDIVKNFAYYGNVQFVMVTGDQMGPYMQSFYDNIGYTFQKDIYVGLDNSMATQDLFAYDGLPQLMVYGKNRTLLDMFTKEQVPSLIKSAITRDNTTPLTKSEMELYLGNRFNIIMGTPFEESRRVQLPADHPLVTGKALEIKLPTVPTAPKVEVAEPIAPEVKVTEPIAPKKGKGKRKKK